MHTARLETVRISVSVAITHSRAGGGGVCPEMNKLEQVSSDYHQMSLVGGGYVQSRWIWLGGGGVWPGG